MKRIRMLTVAFAFLSAASYAQTNTNTGGNPSSTDTSRTGGNQGRSNNGWGNNNSGWQGNQSGGMNRWKDSGYYRRNRANFDTMVNRQKGMWNENEGYLLRGEGDTLRPYNREHWMLDSTNFEGRNWDSLNQWQQSSRWGSEGEGLMNGNSQLGNSGSMNNGSTNIGTDSMNIGGLTNSSTTATMNSDSTNSSNTGTMNNSYTKSGTTNERMNSGNNGLHADTTTKKLSANETGDNTGTTKSDTTSNSGTTGSLHTKKTTHSSSSTDEKYDNSTNRSARNKRGNMGGEDRVFMKGNKLMVSRYGSSSKVGTSITLRDGTFIMADGTMRMKDGSMGKLKKGESLLLKTKGESSNSTTNEQQ